LFLQRILDLVADDLVYTERSELRGLGTFAVYTRPGRIINHPKTGQPIQVPPKETIRFRVSKALHERLNKDDGFP
jgi:nucleoid DNA-binding protein